MTDRIPFTDAHVHFWDLRHQRLRYDWLGPDAEDGRIGDIAAIKSQRYYPEDFAAETRFQAVDSVIHVQAAIGSADPVEETRWLQELANSRGIPQGIVAYVDLASEAAEATLVRHAQYANFRGVRDLRKGDYFRNEAWARGYALLERFKLVCCDATPLEAMRTAAEFVRGHPQTTYCVDHAGYPARRDRAYFSEWSAAIKKLAAVPNTIVKVSALGTYDRYWTVASLRPWILECIAVWGVDRVVFGTNWPVDRLFSSYGDIVSAYREVVIGFDEADQIALLSGNANRVFRLNGEGASAEG